MSVPRLAKTAKILCIFGLLPTAVSFGQAATPPTDFHAARASANRTSAASTAPADLQQQLASLRAQLAALQARLDTLERNAPLAQAAPAHVESAAANNMDKAAPATSSQPGPAAAFPNRETAKTRRQPALFIRRFQLVERQ